MKNMFLVTAIFLLSTTIAMADQGCSIDDGKGSVVDEMKIDKSVKSSGVTAKYKFLVEQYKGYTVRASFSSPDSALAIISAEKGNSYVSAAGIQLALKEKGELIFTVTCGN